MKKKIIGIFVVTLLIVAVLPLTGNSNEMINITEKNESNIILDSVTVQEGEETCAGIVATGSVVKDNRSIFWKQRHISDTQGNKPYYSSGSNYKYFGIGVPGREVKMAMNEAGLSIGSFTANSPAISVNNRQYKSSGTESCTNVRKYVLGKYSTVKDAAVYIATHVGLSSGGVNMGIISSEPGVGAIVSSSNVDGIVWSHITWVNNSWQPIDNRLHCEGICQDPDRNGETIYYIWNDITKHGGSSDGDNKITWEDVCQLGAKSVSDKELGEGTFSTSGEISKSASVGALVAVSGDPSYDGVLNIGWVQLGRQAIVGTFLPLSASCLSSTFDIPHQYRDGGGIEDYLDPKVFYATNGAGQGSNTYYCERVREIQEYANHNEKYMFDAYETIVDNISPGATSSDIKSDISSFVTEMVPAILTAYESETIVSNIPPLKPNTPSGPANGKAGEEYTYSSSTIDSDGDRVYYLFDWGDGTNSDWLGPFDSGETVSAKNNWADKGNYSIKIKAKDVWDYESVWSDPLAISMPKNKPYINTPFLRFLENYPHLFPLLRRMLEL